MSGEAKKKKLPEIEFVTRESVLTEKLKNKDLKTIYNFCLIVVFTLFLHTFLHDYVKQNRLNFGLRIISLGFHKIERVLVVWLSLNALTLMFYFVFILWANVTIHIPPKLQKRWYTLGMVCTLAYYITWFLSIQKIVFLKYSPGSSAIVVGEGVRMIMKQHAFLRSNISKITNFNPNKEKSKLTLPSFWYYLFFLYVPTLVYRDNYPRTDKIRWSHLLSYVVEIIGIIFFFSFIVERYLKVGYEDIGIKPYSWGDILILTIEKSFVGILFLLNGFYVTLHVIQNLFGELLRFGDRLFYTDWWTFDSLAEYHRKWNNIVQNWLYTYVYKDMYEIVSPGNKKLASLTTLLISAVVHEWIVGVILGFFFPLQFLEFFIAGALMSAVNLLNYKFGNKVMMLFMFIGSSSLVNLYCIEYWSRVNCPPSDSLLDFYLPKMFSCIQSNLPRND